MRTRPGQMADGAGISLAKAVVLALAELVFMGALYSSSVNAASLLDSKSMSQSTFTRARRK